MKGPFRLDAEGVDSLPAKPGVYILANERGSVLDVRRACRNLRSELGDVLASTASIGPHSEVADRFWYEDTWFRGEAERLATSLRLRYSVRPPKPPSTYENHAG